MRFYGFCVAQCVHVIYSFSASIQFYFLLLFYKPAYFCYFVYRPVEKFPTILIWQWFNLAVIHYYSRLWCKYDMTRNGHTLEYMDFLKRLGVNTKPKNQVNKGGKIKNYP